MPPSDSPERGPMHHAKDSGSTRSVDFSYLHARATQVAVTPRQLAFVQSIHIARARLGRWPSMAEVGAAARLGKTMVARHVGRLVRLGVLSHTRCVEVIRQPTGVMLARRFGGWSA